MAKGRPKNRNSSSRPTEEDVVDDPSSEGESDLENGDVDDSRADNLHGTGKTKVGKNERKARKAMSKLGLKQYDGVSKIYIRKSKQIFFVINKPDVFKLPNSDIYVIFGEAKLEDVGANSQSEAAQRLSQLSLSTLNKDEPGLTLPSTFETEEVQESDFVPSSSDVELVVQQAGCSREKAVQSLVKHRGNIVESIMELTTM
ncbi:nascent polypeptide associated complex (NAC), alpha chain, putative [Theileria annulata]|uniref:Nascent polypeptide associated complex (NAC), alpha chain, putative n=1 Tax=Theileria annulata TaxID=5874 RepID=Q4U8I7_THEAN|nr:nascent polypeptide associated complex (NAC), alpha chain, putative [Theileria annulata]CAI76866.1 nascent polypeptide associated complex (NAC), alpha chain, putative [Theileria annulata]|eukprot:XP_953491.1 nascent polypeptide associated complex (NAC), alpha chain, putative [Theileria annulata]